VGDFMKKLLLFSIFIVCILALFSSCSLTRQIVEKNEASDEEKQDLTMFLNTLRYPKEIETDVFDCSNAAAFLHDKLIEKGYKVSIVLGVKSIFDIFSKKGHAWLIVDKGGKKFAVEPAISYAKKKVVGKWFYDDFWLQVKFDSLDELKAICKVFGCLDEWEY
jgi:hypothetical protein